MDVVVIAFWDLLVREFLEIVPLMNNALLEDVYLQDHVFLTVLIKIVEVMGVPDFVVVWRNLIVCMTVVVLKVSVHLKSENV
jgi:hypothetical protein